MDSSRHNGMVDAMELCVGGEVVAMGANGREDLVQAVENGQLVQL